MKPLTDTHPKSRRFQLKLTAFLIIVSIAAAACGSNDADTTTTTQVSLTPTALPDRAPTATFAPTTEPVSESGLTGKIFFTQTTGGIREIDLQTGENVQRLSIEEGSFMAGVGVAPDQSLVIAAYSEPPPEGVPQLGETGLYQADFATDTLTLVIPSDSQYESFSNPFITTDWLYFTHYEPLFDENGIFTAASMTIERLPVTDLTATPEVLLTNAKNFSISDDGTRIAYVEQDFENLTEALVSANADGSDPVTLVQHGEFWALEGPHISPDGTTVLFAASGERQDITAMHSARLMSLARGPQPLVSKHGPPWEIWTVPATGGALTQHTNLATDNPWPTWSPDGNDIAIMQPGAVLIMEDPAPRYIGEAFGHGEAVWVP